MRAGLLLSLAGLLSGAACAGGDASTSVQCERACQRDQRCSLGAGSAYCQPDCAERALGLQPAFLDSYMDCYAALECDLASASCEVEASDQVARRPIDDTFLEVCQAKHTECDELFNSAYCFQSHYYERDWLERASTCLTMTCDAVELCLAREMPFAPFGR